MFDWKATRDTKIHAECDGEIQTLNSSRSYVTRTIFTSDEKEILLHNSCEDSPTLRLSHNNFFGPTQARADSLKTFT